MINIHLLKSYIVKNGMTIDEVARNLGINPATLYRKMNGKSELSIGEAEQLISTLSIEKNDIVSIFFNDKLEEM